MVKSLVKTALDVQKVKGLLYAMEQAYLEIDPAPEYRDAAELAVSTFYALQDAVVMIERDVRELEEDSRVVDAIRAAKEARCRNCTLKTEQ